MSDCYDRIFEWGLKHVGEVVEDPHAHGRVDKWEILVAEHQSEIRSVIDIGCADGSLARELWTRGLGKEFTLVDVSASAVEYANAHPFPGLKEVRRCDARNLPFADQSFDLAILSHILEHVANPEEVAADAVRVAREAIVEVPLEDALLSNLRAWFGKRLTQLPRSVNGVGHIHVFSRRTFARTITRWDRVRIKRGLQIFPPGFQLSTPKRALAYLGARAYGEILTTIAVCLLEQKPPKVVPTAPNWRARE